jgi:hypothetical protein
LFSSFVHEGLSLASIGWSLSFSVSTLRLNCCLSIAQDGKTALEIACMSGDTPKSMMLVKFWSNERVSRHAEGFDASKYHQLLHQGCRNGAVEALTHRHRTLANEIDAFVADASALLRSPNLATIVWAALTQAHTHHLPESSSGSSKEEETPEPPNPFNNSSWTRFVSLLPPSVAAELLVRATDPATYFSFLSTRMGRGMTGAGALWPIREKIRELFFVEELDTQQRSFLRTCIPQLQLQAQPHSRSEW